LEGKIEIRRKSILIKILRLSEKVYVYIGICSGVGRRQTFDREERDWSTVFLAPSDIEKWKVNENK